MITETLPCSACGCMPVSWKCENDGCKKSGRSINSRRAWNQRQAGNALLRLIDRYKEKYHTYPEALPLPSAYIKCLPVKFRASMFGVRVVQKT